MDYTAIGKRIRAKRKQMDLSQEELAEMVNISTVHMSHIETGYTKLSLPVLVDIACALGVRTDDLILTRTKWEKTSFWKRSRSSWKAALTPSSSPCGRFCPPRRKLLTIILRIEEHYEFHSNLRGHLPHPLLPGL